jgi:hypothetical protein
VAAGIPAESHFEAVTLLAQLEQQLEAVVKRYRLAVKRTEVPL